MEERYEKQGNNKRRTETSDSFNKRRTETSRILNVVLLMTQYI